MDTNGKIMHQLFQLTRIISQSLNLRFSPYRLHISEWGLILALMEKGALTQGELAHYLSIEPSAVSRSLSGLENKGYVLRKPGFDKREKMVFLTDRAKEIFQECDHIASQHRQNLLTAFTEEQKQELSRMLALLFQSAQNASNDQTNHEISNDNPTSKGAMPS